MQGRVVAQRTNTPSAVVYLHTDHLGSVSAVTSQNQQLVSKQDFTPWGEIRGGGSGIQETSRNFTGQRRDSTGLLYYHARYYDPNLGRFLSADSVVPGTVDGSMEGVALKALTVDFHELGFVSSVRSENQQRFWFQLSGQERQEATPPWGPHNPQALNRYAYVQNNPLKYTDPTGHYVYMEEGEAKTFVATLDVVADFILEHIDDIDLWAKGAAFIIEVIGAILIAKGVTAPAGGILIAAGFAIVAAAELGGTVLGRLADSYKSLGAAVRAANGKEGVTMGMDCGVVWCDFHIKSGRGLNRNPNPTIKLRAWSGFYATWDIRWSYGHNRDYMADWEDLLDSYYLIRA